MICPASVKHNWARELRLALGQDALIRVVGTAPVPEAGYQGWIVVNYDLLRRDIDALLAHRLEGIVFDEGHYIKNHRSQRSVLSRRLVADGAADPVVHVLTGTPLTNRPARSVFRCCSWSATPWGRASSPSPSAIATATRTITATG